MLHLNFRLVFPVLLLACKAFCELEDAEIDVSGMLGVSGRNVNGQIIGGQEAKNGQFPWQVMLLLNSRLQCGASLISDRWVLTAAHCVKREGDYSVRLGGLKMAGFEASRVQMDIPKQNIIIHKEYDSVAIVNDIALIKLPMAVVLPKKPKDNFYINAIRLPKRSEVRQTQEGKMSIISGWGRINPNDLFLTSDVLKWVSLPVMSNAACSAGFGGFIPNSIICVDTNGKNGACMGDSGGPLVILGKDKKYTLYGVTSYVKDVTCLSGPDAYTRVSSFLDWIKKNSGLQV